MTKINSTPLPEEKKFNSEFLNELEWRGFISQITHEIELDKLLNKEKITAYIGFDCTATSLHAGSLVQIMILRLLQKHGHKPLVLLGGGTTKIGDPSGKDEARQILTEEEINKNLNGIKNTLAKFLNFDESANGAVFVNNEDWLKNLNYIEFLRDFGRHFSVNQMLSFDSVKLRLDRKQPLSFLEFNYMILQAYDFYKLHEDYNCHLQIGGSDQWGNIVNGLMLNRKMVYPKVLPLINNLVKDAEKNNHRSLSEIKKIYSYLEKSIINNDYNDFCLCAYKIADIVDKANKEDNSSKIQNIIRSLNVFGLTTPLLTTANGAKMGKTADGAVWLDDKMLSPFDYFQYFRNVDDKDVEKFLKLFTDLEEEEIKQLKNLKNQEINKAKERLAFEVTKICHGKNAANEALNKAREIFINKSNQAFEEKIFTTSKDVLNQGIKLTEIIRELGLLPSAGEAKRMIQGKAVKINGELVEDEHLLIKDSEAFDLSIGKKKFYKILIKL